MDSNTILNVRNNIKPITNALILRHNRLVPPGAVSPYAGAAAPDGWLMCDGSNVSRTTYYYLFNLIGTTYGNGNGTTTFTLPDMRSRFPLAAGNGVGLSNRVLSTIGGEENHTLTIAEMPGHTHSYTDTYRTNNQSTDNAFGTEVAANETATTETKTTGSTGGNAAHNTMPPYLVLNYIIKY